MVTIVTIPKEKVKPGAFIEVKDELDHLAVCRRTADLWEAFINDPTQDELINIGAGPAKVVIPKLSPEQIEERIKAGAGTSGIHTVVEPADLELYRSFMYPPLSMPEKPEVSVTLLDMNSRGNPETHFMEGRLAVKAMCPDGKESWLIISAPVTNVMMCWHGVIIGWPKYVADIMTVTSTKAEVIYEGEVRWSMELTTGALDEATEKELKERGRFEWYNLLTFHPHKGGATLTRSIPGRGEGVKVVEWQAGMVKVYLRPEDPWAGLIPANSVTPGVYQWVISLGGGDLVQQKLKG